MFLEQKMPVFWSKRIAELGGSYVGFVSPQNNLQMLGVTILTNLVEAEDFTVTVVIACTDLVN